MPRYHAATRYLPLFVCVAVAIAAIIVSALVNPHSVSWIVGFSTSFIFLLLTFRSREKTELYTAYLMYLCTLSCYLLLVWMMHVIVPAGHPEIAKRYIAFWTRILCIGGIL